MELSHYTRAVCDMNLFLSSVRPVEFVITGGTRTMTSRTVGRTLRVWFVATGSSTTGSY
jgi:hypothetical protein